MACIEGVLDDVEEPPEQLLHTNTNCGSIPHKAPSESESESEEEEQHKSPSDYVDADYTALDDDDGHYCEEDEDEDEDEDEEEEEEVEEEEDVHGHGHGHGHDMVIDDMHVMGDGVVEYDPSGRYGRYAEVLGKGAMKTVYRAFDFTSCKEVAWNKAILAPSDGPDDLTLAVDTELRALRSLYGHKSILKLYTSWVDGATGRPNFITELCSSTLLGFRLRHGRISRKAVRSWARQILLGLVRMHSHTPAPIVHRDLKCENIFLKHSSSTVLKIGDFGSAAFLDGPPGHHRLHVAVGTPEFMAPEMFEEDYDELVDVYSFGMCLLELLTGECPYSECKSLPEIYKKVSSGQKPASLSRVKDIQALCLIQRCLMHASKRPSAKELLSDPFFSHPGGRWATASPIIKNSVSMPNLVGLIGRFPGGKSSSLHFSSNENMSTLLETEECDPDDAICTKSTSDIRLGKPICTKSPSFRRSYYVTGRVEDPYVLHLNIHIQESSTSCSIDFPFDLRYDTPQSVAEEMIRDMNYPESNLNTIANLINEEVLSFQSTKVGLGKGYSMYPSPSETTHHDDLFRGLDSISPNVDFCDWPFYDSDTTGESSNRDGSVTSATMVGCNVKPYSKHTNTPQHQHRECGDCGECYVTLPQMGGMSKVGSFDAHSPTPSSRALSSGTCKSSGFTFDLSHCSGKSMSIGTPLTCEETSSTRIDWSSSEGVAWGFRESAIGMGMGMGLKGILLHTPSEQGHFRRRFLVDVKAFA